jgi:hypothetical protein
MARICENTNINFLHFRPKSKNPKQNSFPLLKSSVLQYIWFFNSTWYDKRTSHEDDERMLSLFYTALSAYPELKDAVSHSYKNTLKHLYDAEPLFNSSTGIAPYWNLVLSNEPR